MSHYESETKVMAAPDAVFAYVRNPENMPEYLPTVSGASDQGDGRVEVDGAADGHAYHSDGSFEVDDAARTMSWGSDGEHGYSGKLQVRAHEDHSHVRVELEFKAGADASVQEGLDASVRSIKRILEGTGGKESV